MRSLRENRPLSRACGWTFSAGWARRTSEGEVQCRDCLGTGLRQAGVCFLKSDGQRVFRNPNAFAGYRIYLESRLRRSTITIAERTDFPGNDYQEIRDVGFGECSDSCERDNRCRAFTYLARRKSCWLKDSVSEPVESRITISGRKD